jgi:WD40 repeat protein
LCSLPAPDELNPRLASGGADGIIRIWSRLADAQASIPIHGHTDQIRALQLVTAGDGQSLLVSGSHDGTVRLWRTATGEAVHTIPLRIPVHSLAQMDDGETSQRTDGGATLSVGTREGILLLDLNHSLFEAPLLRKELE